MSDPITSVSNPQIKDLVRLRERRHRDQSRTFIVEGYREVSRALDAGVVFERLYVCPELFLGPNEDSLIARVAEGGTVVVASEEAVRDGAALKRSRSPATSARCSELPTPLVVMP